MAIQLNVALSPYGIALPEAYFRIVSVMTLRSGVDMTGHRVMLDVLGYAVRPLDGSVREMDSRRYHAPLADIEAQAGASFLERCYVWLAAQPDMAGGIAV